MDSQLKILLLVNTAGYASVIHDALSKSDLQFTLYNVSSKEEYELSLQNSSPHIVLALDSISQYSPMDAFHAKQKLCNQAGFIIIAELLQEDEVIELLKNGVDDYIFSNSYKRLPSAIFNTYTRRRALQKHQENLLQLELAKKEFDAFVYRASHDIRGPLCSLKGLLNLAQKEQDLNELIKQIDYMESTVNRLDSILINLIETFKIRDKAVANELFSIEALWNEILEEYEHQQVLAALKMSISLKHSPDLIADRVILKSVIRSLVDNAIKFRNPSLEKPYVQIAIEEKEDGIAIHVSDNGIGIRDSMRERIFEMFFRANDLVPGNGLGLYRAKLGIEKLGGNIQLITQEGVGTVVQLHIPHKHKEVLVLNNRNSGRA